jgi:hypothetical protein
VQRTLDLLRGLPVANPLSDDPPRRSAILAMWTGQPAQFPGAGMIRIGNASGFSGRPVAPRSRTG